MHYRNGREAKNGDVVVELGMSDGKITKFGVIYNAVAGNDYCNGNLAPVQNLKEGACMVDCLHIEDLAAILVEKGLDKRPEGK